MTDNNGHIEQEIWFSAVDEQQLNRFDKEAAFARFQERVAVTKTFKPKRNLRWLSYAAVAALVVAVSYFSFKGGQSNLEASFGDIVVEAPQGSRTQMTLPDGTKVWLNAGSKISYTQGFSIINRLVRLIGEGYFEVARNEQLPFRVSSENLQVSVLGTKFNFRDYPTDAEATVSLAEGRVALDDLTHSGKETIYLMPNQRAVMNKQNGSIVVEDYTVSNSIQWTNGNLIFDGEPLKDIINDLERSYNVKITVADNSLLALRFYGDFVRQEQSLSEVLDVLSATGKIHYKAEGRNITLY